MYSSTRRNRKANNSTRKATGGKIRKPTTTMCEINHWHAHLFKKLGWAVLNKAKGYSDKVVQYKKSINDFLKSADKVSKEYENHNRKHDIEVLRENVRELQKFVNKHL